MGNLTAALGVFAGSLFWNLAFGNGIQPGDLLRAATLAATVASLRWLFTRVLRGRQ